MAAFIAYFSRRDENYVGGVMKNLEIGNTELAAMMIERAIHGTLFQIEPVQAYAKDYNTCIAQAQADQKRNARPELKQYPENFKEYDTIYLGYPNYWGTMPMAVFTFLEHLDFSGKTIHPFCTHEGSGFGNSKTDLQRLCPNSTIGQGIAIYGKNVAQMEQSIQEWAFHAPI